MDKLDRGNADLHVKFRFRVKFKSKIFSGEEKILCSKKIKKFNVERVGEREKKFVVRAPM